MNVYPQGVYSSRDVAHRQLIPWDDLQELELTYDDGNEIPIYSHDGFIIQRRMPRFSKQTLPYGILMDLRQVNQLFEWPWDEEDLLIYQNTATDTYTYPQAGLKVAGHFQSNGLMTHFIPFLKKVNENLSSNGHDDDFEDNSQTPSVKNQIVYGVACQGYNAVMHSTRGDSAQHHDAQLGMITGALAGSWAAGNSAERIASQLQKRCARQLPHVSFTEKISNPNISRDFRLENIFYIDIEAMDEDDQNGT
jgi:hypothetical protein